MGIEREHLTFFCPRRSWPQTMSQKPRSLHRYDIRNGIFDHFSGFDNGCLTHAHASAVRFQTKFI